MLPTTPANLTAQGAILGTFEYMAPEQIEGIEADARTDIFAFGALLFEMLTGRPAFEGKTRASLLGAILKDEPPRVSALRPLAPAALDRIVSTCLAKDPEDRYQSARDLLRDLKWVASGASEVTAAPTTAARPHSNLLPWYVAAATALVALAATAWALRPRDTPVEPAEAVQFTINAPDNMAFGGPAAGGTGTATQIAVSPDGRRIVFCRRRRRAISDLAASSRRVDRTADPGHRGGRVPVLVTRQPVHRVLCVGQAEEDSGWRRTADRPLRRAGGARRHVEPRQRDRVRTLDRCADAGAGRRRNTNRHYRTRSVHW
jgi:hypothetical protein